ncbi:helix-turn-helix transcriptional regulator [Arthrobacter sp. AET 35A]|uniref:helix-turn-helix transcriptional regulator n=1 Tax=Arthrobacter sp. AET 35A TaxID=2292643 RepID=UPI001783A855|nr:LuxR family transcriptional regulator [Arthrobacter sp. AET 35A]MBE0011170.1 hypothetical protein [Arthrobacter sp. AET 35A]
MVRHTPPGSFVGRFDDRAWLAALIASAADGSGAAGVLRGEAGIGKTSLVLSVLAGFPGLRVQPLTGVETESDLPYGALQRFVLAHRGWLEILPPDQRAALLAACGLTPGAPAPRPLVGLGVLGLLSGLSAGQPLVWFCDDAQWLDSESLAAFAFAGRRLTTERVALLFVARSDDDEATVLDDFPTHTLGGLTEGEATTLLTSSSPHPVDPRVAQRLVRSSGGNPLVLVQLPGALTHHQLSGEEALPDPIPAGRWLQGHYLREIEAADTGTRLWLLTAAAEPDGNLEVITAASEALGLGRDASCAAETAGLVRVDRTVEFRHPLVRSAIYHGAPRHDVRAVHAQLATVAQQRGETYRQILHRCAATIGPDDEVAAALEGQAQPRGGHDYTTRATLLLRAAALTSSAPTRTSRLLAASEYAIAAGSGVQASALLKSIDPNLLDDVGRGRLIIAHCEMDIAAPSQGPQFPLRARRLLSAARLFRATEPDRARQAIISAFWALVLADELVQGTSSREIAEEARLICGTRPSGHLPTQALVALSTLVLDGRAAAAPLVGEASRMATTALVSEEDVLQSCVCIAYAADLLHDPASSSAVILRAERIARGCGATLALCRILLLGAYESVLLGEVSAGREKLRNAASLVTFMGLPPRCANIVTSLPALRGWSGDEFAAVEENLTAEARSVGYGISVSSHLIGTMLLRASQGRYVEAWDAGRLVKYDDPFYVGAHYLPDLIECAARAGDYPAAAHLLQKLKSEECTAESRMAAGLRERSLALLAADESTIHFDRALDLLAQPGLEMDAARTHLLYGEWLRRRRRRSAAARHLSTALDLFRNLDAPCWANRASRELATLGEVHPQTLRVATTLLTSQELAVASLARDGFTNSDIAVRLFVSPNTVDYHLRKVFRKVGVRSRRQLQGIDLSA